MKDIVHFKKSMTILVVIVIIMFGQDAFSQDAKKKKRTVIDFDDQLIEGQAQKPELFYLLQQKEFNFQRLIKMRENFIPEMERTAEDVERKGR